MCRDFQAGQCNRDRCKFSHGDADRSRSRDRDGDRQSPPSYGQMPGYGYPAGYGYPQPGYGYGYPQPCYGAGSSLPPGWEQYPDPATGRPYFCNRSTGETSWTPPTASNGKSSGGCSGGGLPPGWEEARDPQSG